MSVRILLHRDGCDPVDVTEAVQITYDALHAGMDFGSGFLDTQEVEAMRALAKAAGWERPEYPGDLCASCGHQRGRHIYRTQPRPCVERVVLTDPGYERVLSPQGYTVSVERQAGERGDCPCLGYVESDTP